MNADKKLLNEAYQIMNSWIENMPICSCSEGYTLRNLTDPSCIYCDNFELNETVLLWLKQYHGSTTN